MLYSILMSRLLALVFLVQSGVAENECQNLDNCPYNYNNTMEDYMAGAPVEISSDLRNFMMNQTDIYLNKVTKEYPPEKVDTFDVFQGVGGRALMHLRIYNRTLDHDHLMAAKDYIEVALSGVHNIGNYVGFLWGPTGVYCVGAVIATLTGDETAAIERIAQVQNIFDQSTSDKYALYDDFDAGRAGLLSAATFLENFYGKQVITRESIVNVAKATVERGYKLSRDPQNYLEWISPNDGGRWLGQSHGSAGVLVQLLDVPEIMDSGGSLVENSAYRDMIIKTLDHLVANQFPSGNFPSEYHDADEDLLVQWDHGAPGVLGALVKASEVLNDSKYLDSARLAADCVWERGLLYKGLQLCHGIVGNTYMQIFMHKYTLEDKYMYRALQFQEFVSRMPELYDVDLMRYPTPNPYGFYVGSFESAIMLWSDLLAVVKGSDYLKLSMPGYDGSL